MTDPDREGWAYGDGHCEGDSDGGGSDASTNGSHYGDGDLDGHGDGDGGSLERDRWGDGFSEPPPEVHP